MSSNTEKMDMVRKKLGENQISEPESQVIWSTLREKVSNLAIGSIDKILDLKDENPVAKLEGVFSVVTHTFESEEDTLSKLTTEGVKVELQENFDDYCSTLGDLVEQYTKKASGIITSLEKEVKRVTDVVVEVEEDNRIRCSTKDVVFVLAGTALLIFLDLYSAPDELKTNYDFLHGTVIFITTLFVVPIVILKSHLFEF